MSVKLIKTMLVDDHNLFREGTKIILERESDIKVIAEAVDGIEAVNMAIIYNPDIILMDINMPNSNGLEALRKIKDLGVKTKVIMLTSEAKREYIIEAIKIGAKGFIQKTSTSKNLIIAIREIDSGRNYLQPSLARVLTQVSKVKLTPDHNLEKIDLLSKREYEILLLISTGYNNKEIGERLFISEKTVKNHITNLFKKIEVKDRVQAVIFSYANNIKSINN
ncbi:MAG: response regulator transcription factor [Tissierellia bacterium]|jgi:DNA-binding NarL/FixJ family response regulator|nr:response regulator transcription factor [Tissierellia bacterium]